MVQSLLKKGIIWQHGDRSLIRTWRDPWIQWGHNLGPVTPKGNCHFNRVADFLDENGAWLVQRVNNHFWPMDVWEILKIQTSPSRRQDFFAWHSEKNGQFTVKSVYHLATAEHDDQFSGGSSSANPEGNRSVWNIIWRLNVPLRMKHMA